MSLVTAAARTALIIAPSLFENTGNEGIIDEWTFGKYQDYNTARIALVNHWETWIQEDDIAQIAGTFHNMTILYAAKAS